MNMNSIEYKLTKLERQVSTASATDKKLVTLRLRRLIAAVEPTPAPRAFVIAEDDLLFDNVPV